MEKSARQDDPMPEAGAGDLRLQERRSVRRKLIQTTLFPHKSEEIDANGDKKEEKDCGKDEHGENEECCGSQGKKKGRRKGKSITPPSKTPSRTPRKLKGKRQVNTSPTENVNTDGYSAQILSNPVQGECESPQIPNLPLEAKGTAEENSQLFSGKQIHPFFSSQEDQKGEKVCGNNEADEDEEYCGSQGKKRKGKGRATPPSRAPRKQLKENKRVDTTPTKNAATNLVPCEDALPIPNLRLEAKMTAEENSRMFAGRQIHPFFTSLKSVKRNQEINVESNWCSVERMDKTITLGPIHVFERTQDNDVPLDWRDWKFSEETFTYTGRGLECNSSSIYEGFAESLRIDHSLAHSSHTDFFENEVKDQYIIKRDHHDILPIVPTVLVDEHVACYKPLKDTEKDFEEDKFGYLSGHASCLRKSDHHQQNRFLEERMMSYYLDCSNQPGDSLWTAKYQPKKSMEVCGNDEYVKLLSDWLRLWHERDFKTSKDSSIDDQCNMQDNDYDCNESDSGSDNIDEGASLKNVLLITGPVGSGKSAAIYACAREQGFEVTEVNASECRSGTALKKNYGEALLSHRLKRSLENHVDSPSKHILKSLPALPNGKASHVFGSEVVELISVSDDEELHDAIGTSGKSSCKDIGTSCDQVDVKTLTLIEDVDITFPEDRGFIAAIQEIAVTAKRPVILTSNNNNPVLPDNLERLELCFTVPSPKDLLCHVYMVCAAEKANLQPHLIEHLIQCCEGDMRKTIMHLQFWCQGKRYRGHSLNTDGKVHRAYNPLLFNLEAGHQMLPQIIPWGFPSQLSELVEKEISKSLSMMEDNSTFIEAVNEEDLHNNEMYCHLEINNNERDHIEFKKEAMLSRNCSLHTCDETVAQPYTSCERSNSLGSPVAFSRLNGRRKVNLVLSSDSEDEFVNDGFPFITNKDTDNIVLEVNGGFPFHFLETATCLSPSTDKLLHSETEKLEENCYQCSEIANDVHINDACKSADLSCVPESSFVPDTVIDNGTELSSKTVYCDHLFDTLEVSVNNELVQKSSLVDTDNIDEYRPILQKNTDMVGNSCDVIAESSYGEDENFLNEYEEAVTRRYQVMDECSRMVFNRKSKSKEKPRSWMRTDLVQASWKKLRGCHTDLREYADSEERDTFRILEVAYAMSNLISEADLLLSNCQPLLRDSWEPLIPSEELDAYSWCYEQMQMTSTISQHGFCFYAKDIAAVGPNMDSESRVDLAPSTVNLMALGKLIRQEMETSNGLDTGRSLDMSPPKNDIQPKSEMKSDLFDMIQSIVPSRTCLALKGSAFHEYFSSLSRISRLGASSLLQGTGKTKRRRARAAKHYLSTGALMLSPEDISLLGQHNLYGNQSGDASCR